MMNDETDKIEKVVELKASVSRVWKAISDHEQFGQWFRVKLDGPFEVGKVSTGGMTFPGYEGWPWRAIIEQIEPERLFVFRWHDFDDQSGVPIEDQPTTRVEFRLEPAGAGTRLTITESGFAAIPNPRRLEVFRNNSEGWSFQVQNLAGYVGA